MDSSMITIIRKEILVEQQAAQKARSEVAKTMTSIAAMQQELDAVLKMTAELDAELFARYGIQPDSVPPLAFGEGKYEPWRSPRSRGGGRM
eukprot:SAG31_NODE_5475_length_2518_cov_1.939231_3_plen_91_part_00